MDEEYVVRELVAVAKLSGSYGKLWIIWRGVRILTVNDGWMEYPDVSDVLTFKNKRMARRTGYEWQGFSMKLDDALDHGWISD